MWVSSTGRTGLVAPEHIINKVYKNDLSCASLDDVSELYGTKNKKLDTDIFTYFRKNINYNVPELAGIDPPLLRASPTNLKVELYIIEKVFDLYSSIESYYSTTLEHDVFLLNSNINPKLRSAVRFI